MEENIETPQTKRRKTRLILFSSIFVVVIWIILIVVHQVAPDFGLIWVFVIPGALILLGGIIIGILQVKKKFEKNQETIDSEIPKPATTQEIEAKVKEYFLETPGMENHVKKIVFTRPKTPNKNEIYALQVDLLYPYDEEKPDSKKVYVIVNANYLHSRAFIVENINISPQKLVSIMNEHSVNPQEEPDTIVKRTKNDTLGIETETKKTTHKKNSKKGKSASQEDIS